MTLCHVRLNSALDRRPALGVASRIMSEENAPAVEVLKVPLPPGWNMTAMQRAAVGAFLEGKSRREAVTLAGYSTKEINSTFHAIVSSTRVRPALALALKNAGVTDQLKAEVLAGALGAKREYCAEGVVIDGGADHPTRLKALKIALDLDGDLGGMQLEGSDTFESRIDAAQVAGYTEE